MPEYYAIYKKRVQDFSSLIQPAIKGTELNGTPSFFWWGSIIIKHPGDGKYYVIADGWDNEVYGWNSWQYYNKIYVSEAGNTIDECFESTFTDLTELRSQPSSANVCMAPRIYYENGTYYMFYAASFYSSLDGTDPDNEARANKRVHLATATHPQGPWTPAQNNPIIDTRLTKWDTFFTSNAVVWRDVNGLYRMIYKSNYYADLIDTRLGMATSTDLFNWTGRTDEPNFVLDASAEDPEVWYNKGYWYCIAQAEENTTINGVNISRGDGVFFYSSDGITFVASETPLAYTSVVDYTDGTTETYSNVERPHVYVEDGELMYFTTSIKEDNSLPLSNQISYNIRRELNI
jgi:hypothetical protein